MSDERRQPQNPFDNPAFREEMLAMLKPITDKVEAHETALQRAKGAGIALGVLWTFFIGAVEYVFHKH